MPYAFSYVIVAALVALGLIIWLLGRMYTVWGATLVGEAEASVRASQAQFHSMFDNTAVGIVLCDWRAKIVRTNGTFQRMLGFAESDLVGKPSGDLSPVEDVALIHTPVRELYARKIDHFEVEQRYVRADGTMIWGHLTASRFDDGRHTGVLAVIQDISQWRQVEAQLVHRTSHDALTDLANRTQFHTRLERALIQKMEAAQQVAVLLLDLDNFKAANDMLGHGIGDELLVAVAGRLLNATRGCDTVARIGGDEFAILLQNVRDDPDALIVAERVVNSLRQPFATAGQSVFLGASVGIARAGDGETADDVMRNADIAMYAVKRRGKGGHQMFESGMRTRVVERIALERGFRLALDREEFHLMYQPIVEIGSGRLRGMEALVRWSHPEQALLTPASFIPFAEESGLIVPLGRWVLRQACRETQRWHEQHPRHGETTVSVNVSGRQLQEGTIVDDVRSALSESGLPPQLLTLEITESFIMQDTQRTLSALHALKELGIRLAVDDFGTGYSSLAYLQQFPIDVLKIDKTFVDGVARKESDKALARTIIALGEMLELRCVAEGIEEVAQRQQLERLGCELGQGYLFSPPLAASAIEELLGAEDFALAMHRGDARVAS